MEVLLTLVGAMVLPLVAVIFAMRKQYLRGITVGVSSVIFLIVFEWLWHSAFVRPGDDNTWLGRAFSRASTIELIILVCGLSVILVNTLLLIQRKKHIDHSTAVTKA